MRTPRPRLVTGALLGAVVTSAYDGRASWVHGVPRHQRHATAGTSDEVG